MKQIQLLFLIIIVCLISCQTQMKFDKVKWQTTDDPAFPPEYRNAMLKDLLTNYHLGELNRKRIIELLGEPNFSHSNSLGYTIVVDYGRDIDPVYEKNLIIVLNQEEAVEKVFVDEWKK